MKNILSITGKRLSLFGAVLVCATGILSAQVTFEKTYGMAGNAVGRSIKNTFDGGYIIAGSTTITGTFNSDICLIKTDVNGDTLWTRTFGGLNADYGYSVTQTSDSGYIVAGTMEIGPGNSDGYLIKTNSSGHLIWSKIFGGTGFDNASCVLQASDGGYIISGRFFDGTSFAQLIKFNSIGNILWTKDVSGAGAANDVKQTNDNGYIVTGNDYNDIFLTKINSGGNILWSKLYSGIYSNRGASVQQTSDGGYIVTGNIYNSVSSHHYTYLLKTNSLGDTLWVKTYSGTGNDYGYCVQQTPDDGYVVVGVSSVHTMNINPGDVSLFKTNSTGSILWGKAYSGSSHDVANSFGQTSDGGFIISGATHDYPGSGEYFVYLIKTDSLGNGGCNDTSWTPSVIPYDIQVIVPTISLNSATIIATSPVAAIGGGSNVNTLCTSVGSNEYKNERVFQIFPNPSSGIFNISFEKPLSRGTIEIFNTLGESVFTDNIYSELNKEFQVQHISSGIYVVKVNDGENFYSRKIIIQ